MYCFFFFNIFFNSKCFDEKLCEIFQKIDAYNFNGTMSTVDWDGLAENMHMYLTAMNAPNEIAKDFEHLMNKMNVTKLLENFGKMDQNGMQNITMDEVNG